jgi:hypothetical protein
LYDESELKKFSLSCNPKPLHDDELKRFNIIDGVSRFLPVHE